MTTARAHAISSCIAEAARLVASQPGAAERILAAHRRKRDGRCSGCGTSRGRWPCTLVAIARLAADTGDR